MNDSVSKRPQFSPLEEVVMEAIWAGNKTTREIYDALPEEDQRRLTFSTLSAYLIRMMQKGQIRREATATREFHYFAVVSEGEAAANSLLKWWNKWRMKPGGLSKAIRGFTNDDTLDAKIREELKAFAKELKERDAES